MSRIQNALASPAFETWMKELIETTSIQTGLPLDQVRVNREQAVKWYLDGFTPYQCFRETWANENDSE